MAETKTAIKKEMETSMSDDDDVLNTTRSTDFSDDKSIDEPNDDLLGGDADDADDADASETRAVAKKPRTHKQKTSVPAAKVVKGKNSTIERPNDVKKTATKKGSVSKPTKSLEEPAKTEAEEYDDEVEQDDGTRKVEKETKPAAEKTSGGPTPAQQQPGVKVKEEKTNKTSETTVGSGNGQNQRPQDANHLQGVPHSGMPAPAYNQWPRRKLWATNGTWSVSTASRRLPAHIPSVLGSSTIGSVRATS